MTYLRRDVYEIPDIANIASLEKVLLELSKKYGIPNTNTLNGYDIRMQNPTVRILFNKRGFDETQRETLTIERINEYSSFPKFPDYLQSLLAIFHLKPYSNQIENARDLINQVLSQFPPLKKGSE